MVVVVVVVVVTLAFLYYLHYFILHFFARFLNVFLLFCTFSLSICVLYFVWAASYDGIMPPLAACHCNNSYESSMLCTWK